MGKAVSWRKLKAEYVAGGISQRKLAEKYGVPFGTLQRQARVKKWNAARKAAESKAIENVTQKTAETVADNAVVLERVKGKLLAKLETMVDAFPTSGAAEMKIRTKTTETKYSMRDIAAVYAALEQKTQTGKAVDIEDLSPLVELLRE